MRSILLCVILAISCYGQSKLIQSSFGPYDSKSKSVIGIQYDHFERHRGNSYFYADTATLGSGDSLVLVMEVDDTPNVTPHMVVSMRTSNTVRASLYENSRGITGGDTVQARNHNRYAPDSSAGIRLIRNATVDTFGTLLIPIKSSGAAGGSGDISFVMESGRNEILLRRGYAYTVKIVSGAASNAIFYEPSWYLQGVPD